MNIECVKIMLQLMSEIASERFLDSITFLIENSNNKLLEDDRKASNLLNRSRRYVASVYERVQMLREMDVFDDAMVSRVLEPGSVRVYLDVVHPLNVKKVGSKASVVTEKEFWERYT